MVRIILVALALTTGCVDHDGPAFFISGVSTPDDECGYAPDNAFLLRGKFNAEFGGDYTLYPILNNQLLDRVAGQPFADPNHVLITSAVVELQDAAGVVLPFPGLPNPFTVAVSDFVRSSTGDVPRQNVGSIQVIPPAYAAALDVNEPPVGLGTEPLSQMVVVVQVELFGETVGGVDVESNAWTWPVDVCQGTCLYRCVGPAVDIADENRCECGQNFQCSARMGSGAACP